MQFAGADGSLHASLYTSAFSLGDGKRSLFGKSGAALVIHAAGDDYASQPEGRSGVRVACGPILKDAASAHHRKKK
jgi:Cu-Zn family superoxide dismutase